MQQNLDILLRILKALQSLQGASELEVRTQTWGSPHVWLTAEEMAKLLSSSNDALTDKTLKDKAAQGVIRGHKIPGCNRWRFNPREVSEDIRNQGNEGFAVVKRRAKNKATEIIARHRRAAG